MLFADVRDSLISALRARVRNGELTERGLARTVGISQPHMHNVLKGTRLLSPELSDQIMQHLRMSLLDLIERERIVEYCKYLEKGGFTPVSVLNGRLGPGHPSPATVHFSERAALPSALVGRLGKPVAARLAGDARMHHSFGDGDLVLLDCAERARTELEPGAYYAIRSGSGMIVRRVRSRGEVLYLVTDDTASRPAAWGVIRLNGRPLEKIIRARAYLLNPSYEWT